MFSHHVWQLKTGNHTFQVTWFTPSSTRAEANKDYRCSLFTDFVIAEASWQALQLAGPYNTELSSQSHGESKKVLTYKIGFQHLCYMWYPLWCIDTSLWCKKTPNSWKKTTKSYTKRHHINVMVTTCYSDMTTNDIYHANICSHMYPPAVNHHRSCIWRIAGLYPP